MRTRPVHWSEGMLILPHHFQAFQANLLDWVTVSDDWRAPYGYGLRTFELNDDALADYQVRIPRLQARMRDGTLVSVPENAHLETLDLTPALTAATDAYLHLAIPEVVPGRSNASRNGREPDRRYVVDSEEWEERNEGGNSRPVETERLNVQLLALPSLEAPKGFESIPIGRLTRSQEADAPPKLDREYVPPLLACDCWTALKQHILVAIGAQLGAFTKHEADYLRTHGGWSEANQPQIRKRITQLNAVNSSYPYLVQLTEARGVHPFLAYTELCRLMGQLSLFRDDWQPPDLPLYDHDDLGRIFKTIKIELDRVLQPSSEAGKVQRFPFQGVQEWMEVALDARWLRGDYGFYMGVRSDLTPERLEKLFSNRWLNWKLGSSRTIADIYRNGEAGLALERVVGVHASLPALSDYAYFRIEPRGHYWDQVNETRTVALKVNERYVRGDFVGKSTITVIDPKKNSRDLKLELFVVENE